MTSHTSSTVLQNAALASGLLSQQQLDDALASLAVPQSGGPPVNTPISDEVLGQRLVELGYLNRWQVEQLKEGRTKFTLGPYRIVNAIGQGGMGHVFKAEHKLLGRIEAIKVLPKSKSTPEAVAAFQREIRAQAQLDHPNLVRISYADFEGDAYFFVTEFVPGTDLRKLVRRNGPLTVPVAATIISQAAAGLHHAHRRGLVHRDVKPGNLLVTPDGHTKITDLGLAWFLMDELADAKTARVGTLVGTADYLAPESIREPAKVRPVSDVYSLGCTMYYAVTGKVPFPGGTTAEKIRRHLEEVPLNPLHFNPDLPEPFCDIIAAMMDKNPSTRTPTAAAVVELLRPWCNAGATRHLAEAKPALGNSPARVVKSAVGPTPALDETASFVLDDIDVPPNPLESPSQISQGTVPLADENEDTLSSVEVPRRSIGHLPSELHDRPADSHRWRAILFSALLMAAGAAAAAWLAGLL